MFVFSLVGFGFGVASELVGFGAGVVVGLGATGFGVVGAGVVVG
ncbi:MAG: hypothetical protein RLZZ107_471, partial [Bacteroidota bacterium]